jgi:hypothetical protein
MPQLTQRRLGQVHTAAEVVHRARTYRPALTAGGSRAQAPRRSVRRQGTGGASCPASALANTRIGNVTEPDEPPSASGAYPALVRAVTAAEHRCAAAGDRQRMRRRR